MFRKILVATDLSEASDHLISCLTGLRKLGAEEAVLCHALGLRHLEDLKHLLLPKVEQKILQQVALLEQQGFHASYEVATGVPRVEVNRLAEKRDVSLIVVGSHGHTLAHDVLLGSSALDIIQNATRPVLIIRFDVTEGKFGNRCKIVCSNFKQHILFPTDFSDTAERAFSFVRHLVEQGARKVTLLHVQDRVRIGKHLEHKLEEFNRIDQERLERMKIQLEDMGATDVRIEIPYGSPLQEIIQRSNKESDVLIVMGSQGRGFILEVFLGSVALNVARLAAAPVLLVPALRK